MALLDLQGMPPAASNGNGNGPHGPPPGSRASKYCNIGVGSGLSLLLCGG